MVPGAQYPACISCTAAAGCAHVTSETAPATCSEGTCVLVRYESGDVQLEMTQVLQNDKK